MYLVLKTADISITPQTSLTIAAFVYMAIEYWSVILAFETKIAFLMVIILFVGYRIEESSRNKQNHSR